MNPTSDTQPLLRARGIAATLDVGGEPVRVLDGVDFEISAGEIVDISGPSGSGKTTLLRAIALLLPGARGELALGGTRASEMSPQSWRCLVALLPQKPATSGSTVRDNLTMPWRMKARASMPEAPSDADLRAGLDLLGMHVVELDRDIARLSAGQLARVAFLRTLLTSPKVMLLDEPDASLDDESAALLADALVAFVAEGERAVVRVRHRGDDGRATRRLRLESGRLTLLDGAR